ncbi:MAG: hypothetical protein EBX50_15150 [Chitinophagia bacterium]|nr:hypothetical protein [Chitinophagia bacterium]
MKRIFLLALFAAAFCLTSGAQELKKVMLFTQTAKFGEAKNEIDKAVQDPKFSGKAETYYWKSRIYAAFFKDAALRAKVPNAKEIADEAFAKYQQLDANFTFVKEIGQDGPNGYFDLYQGCFADGVRTFNAKKWDSAAYYFSSSVNTYDLIYKNKWTSAKTPFDTTSILYLGYSLQNAQKPAEAVIQYTRLADNKVADEAYIDMYRFTLNHFITNKEEAQFKKYLALSKELYSKENWEDYEMEYLDKNLNLAEKTAYYDRESAAGTLSEFKLLQFGDWFANVRIKEKDMDSTNHAMYNMKSADAYQKAFAINNKNSIAAFNAGLIYYNNFADYSDKYSDNIRTLQQMNASRPPLDKDPKKKAAQEAKFKEQTDAVKKLNADLEKPINENLDLAISWLEKSVDILKSKTDANKTEKMVFERSLDFLANMYEFKRDKIRGKDLKLFDQYDAKYKEYESMHKKN